MKKILIVAMMCLMNLVASAQTEHASFKGISMAEPPSVFVNRLTKEGFKLEYEEDECTVLTGKFAGESDCMVLLYSERGLIYDVMVLFPHRSSWELVKSQYESFKENFMLKYGTVPQELENLDLKNLSSDLMIYNALREGKKWSSRFKIPGGYAYLSVNYAIGHLGYFLLSITYQDEANDRIRKSSVIDDI